LLKSLPADQEGPQSNESLQIIIEELRCEIKAMKNGRFGPGEIALELVKYEREYLHKWIFRLSITIN